MKLRNKGKLNEEIEPEKSKERLSKKMKPETTKRRSNKKKEPEKDVEQLKFEGSCYCGSCQFTCEGKPMFSSICHCSICTGMCGGIAVTLVGFENDTLKIVKGSKHLRGFKATERMERFHCEICSSSVYNQSLLNDRLFRDTPLANFKKDDQGHILHLEQLKPDSHIFFSQCQLCYSEMFKKDGLIKFSSMPGSTIIPNDPSK